MASEVMSSALLMIATIIAAVALINAVFPSIYGMSGSITAVSTNVNDRMKSDIKFIYETSDHTTQMTAWVKNTGKTSILLSNFNYTDMFYGQSNGAMTRAVLNQTSAPSWTYAIENGDGNGKWDPGETMRITINATTPFLEGNDYRLRITLPNGVYCEDYFTL